MAKKVYAVKSGFDSKNNCEVKNRIVNTWAECLSLVKGVKNAQYKSFTTLSEAEEYLGDEKKALRKGEDEYAMDILHAYVDGSYNSATGEYSYGLAIVLNNVILHIDNGAEVDDNARNIRQIAGELKGAELAAEYAIENNHDEIVIFHDYIGVCNHAIGTWERKEESSKRYFEKMNRYMNEKKLKITFVKVDSHTGDLYNEIADELAKKAVGIPVKFVSDKIIKSNEVMVKNENLKENLKNILKEDTCDNVIVEEGEVENNSIESKSKIVENSKITVNEILKEIAVALNKNEEDGKEAISRLEEDMKDKIIFTLVSTMVKKKK